MRKISTLSVASLLVAGLAGCQSLHNEDVGVIAGGTAGALLGSTIGHGAGRVIATGVGAILGGLIGKSIGQYMDRQDKDRLNRALETTRTGHTYKWKNPDTGYAYSVEPTSTFSRSGRACRRFRTRAHIEGRTQNVYGTACRDANGQWKIVS